jgi:hypothetical protein
MYPALTSDGAAGALASKGPHRTGGRLASEPRLIPRRALARRATSTKFLRAAGYALGDTLTFIGRIPAADGMCLAVVLADASVWRGGEMTLR